MASQSVATYVFNVFPVGTAMALIQQWEEAGLALSNALQKYLSACISLTAIVSHSNTQHSTYLIDTALGPQGLHASLAQRLAQSRSILAQARNRMSASPICYLPEDILVKIFTNVVYSHRRNTAVYMGQTIKSIYKRLHALLGVCSSWRHIGLNHSELWFLVPVIYGDSKLSISRAPNLSLQRTSGSNLHLGAIISRKSHHESINIKDVATQVSRFRIINILTESDWAFREIFDQLLWAGVPKLSELSLCLDYEPEPDEDLAISLKQRFLFESTYTYLPRFTKLLESVSKFRLSGVGAYWDRVTFSDRLVEMRLEDCVLGYESDLAILLGTLASASELQFLHLISITTFVDTVSEVLEISGETAPVTFPKLKALHLEDLYFNTLWVVMKSIVQGSHDLTIFLTPKCLLVAAPVESRFEHTHLDAVCEVVSRTRISTLMLSAKHEWLNEQELEMILRSAPSLKSLKLERWRFQAPVCQALTRPHQFDNTFPRIESLLLNSATIHDSQKFKEMISSHSGSIQQMVLGVAFYSKATQPSLPYRDLIRWLESQVPSFRLVPGNYTPQDLESRIWQLCVRVVLGSHKDQELIIAEVSKAGLVFQVSNLDDLELTQAIVAGLKIYKRETGKRALYFHTTGTATYMDEPTGELKEIYSIWDDTDKHRLKTAVSIDAPHRIVDLEAIKAHDESTADVYIICPPTIYGVGTGPVRRTSVQIPQVIRVFLEKQDAVYIGPGTNIWSNIHVNDLVRAFLVILEYALSVQCSTKEINNTHRDGFDNFYFTVGGEHSWGPVINEVARAMHQRGLLKTSTAKSVPADSEKVLSYYVGATSRVRATRLSALGLGWEPKEKSIIDTIDEDVDASLEMIRSNRKPNF